MSTLDNIAVFIRVMEHGSFSGAARALRLSPAVVSYRIQALEKHLNCRLFIRTTRQVQPTEHGRTFYEGCVEVQDALDRAEARVAGGGLVAQGSLKVTAPLWLGRHIIAPLMPGFRLAQPKIDIRLRLSDYLVDLYTESVDLAFRMAPLPDSGLVVRNICPVERVICAAPAYLARHGAPANLRDLERHHCLLLRFAGPHDHRWPLLREGAPVNVPVRGNIDADDSEVLTGWALAGEGLALRPVFEVAEHLHSGALVPVLTEFPPQPISLALLHAYKRQAPPKVRLFADAVVDDVRMALEARMALVNPKSPRAPPAP